MSKAKENIFFFYLLLTMSELSSNAFVVISLLTRGDLKVPIVCAPLVMTVIPKSVGWGLCGLVFLSGFDPTNTSLEPRQVSKDPLPLKKIE